MSQPVQSRAKAGPAVPCARTKALVLAAQVLAVAQKVER